MTFLQQKTLELTDAMDRMEEILDWFYNQEDPAPGEEDSYFDAFSDFKKKISDLLDVDL